MLVHTKAAPLTNKRSYRFAARCNVSLQGWSFTAQQFEDLEVYFAVLAADKAERLQPLSPAFVDLIEGLHKHLARRSKNDRPLSPMLCSPTGRRAGLSANNYRYGSFVLFTIFVYVFCFLFLLFSFCV